MKPTRVTTSVVTKPAAMRVIPKAHIKGQVVGVGNSTPSCEECSCSSGFIRLGVAADDVHHCENNHPDRIDEVPVPGDHNDMLVVIMFDASG